MSVTTRSTFTLTTKLVEVIRDPRGSRVIEQFMPDLLRSPVLHTLLSYPVGLVVGTEPILRSKPELGEEIRTALEAIDLDQPIAAQEGERYVPPSVTYESEGVALGSAEHQHPAMIPVYGQFSLKLVGPTHGNPYVDVDLRASFSGPDGTHEVPGFYRGDGNYEVRFMPMTKGEYSFTTWSNARSLSDISGEFRATSALAGGHGPVEVVDTFHFAHADGTRHLPIGTTAYAWIHQDDELQDLTLKSLASAPFNKMRMCLFPKSYLFNENEPVRYPFEGSPEAGFDYQRPSPEYWDHLERRIDQLGRLGIEADLILFHAYDRWGFSTMGEVADDRYVKYAVARLASFPNVWWSMANEYDLLFEKTHSDWERLAQIIVQGDPANHMLSIHNCREFYDYSRPWITHASIQRIDVYRTAEMTTEWRAAWGKPVVIDECAYEGNIDQGWGNITGEEMTRRFWEGALRGGYVGHGETYVADDDVLWWSKGGELHGSSPHRIAFLRRVLEDGPASLEPLPLDWDALRAGVDHEYLLYYFGSSQPSYRRFLLDPSVRYTVDIIDTWEMTIDRLEGTYSGRFRIELPGKQYIAVRLRAVTAEKGAQR